METQLGTFAERCREAGLKATHQRIEIYRELCRTDEHPDAETIYRRVKDRMSAISFDTVYRTLKTLEEKGLIARVGSPLERFRFDANLESHQHFICNVCGRIIDFQ
ncbi:MAG: Fur family transcriptional regulator [Lentisphaeria bacterium]|jgi:Fur family peroxide stress response transcriptional regulator|nr:Fur family transcriptional regulator [Lentisphaeria bacterium]